MQYNAKTVNRFYFTTNTANLFYDKHAGPLTLVACYPATVGLEELVIRILKVNCAAASALA
jgi:hypothetical protein